MLGDHERLRCIVRSVIGQHERRAVHRRVDVAREVRPGMRHVAQQRRVGAGPHEIVQVAGDGGHRGFEQGQRVSHVAMRTHDRRCTAEHLAAFTANEVAERHEQAMLLGDVADESLPSIHAGRAAIRIATRPRATCRCRRRHEYHLGAVQRGDRAGDGVPGILADQHRGAAPRRVEGAHVAAGFHEACLVEQAVGGKEVLAMHMPHDCHVAAKRDIHHAVVQRVAPALVEADHHVDRAAGRRDRDEVVLQVGGQRAGGDRQVADAAFQEVPGEGGFREMHHVGAGNLRERLSQQAGDLRAVGGVVGLGGAELREAQAKQSRHAESYGVLVRCDELPRTSRLSSIDSASCTDSS